MVFVSSVTFASQELQGSIGADRKCNELAKASGNADMFENREYVAWIADDVSLPPSIRLLEKTKPYVRPDGELVANTFAELQDEGPCVAIEIDEKGMKRSGIVWSGTSVQGVRSQTPNCSNWFGAAGVGNKGRIASSMPDWTDEDGFVDCNNTKARLYCFEK